MPVSYTHLDVYKRQTLALMAIAACCSVPALASPGSLEPSAGTSYGIDISLTFKPKKSGAISVDYKVKPKLAGFQKSETVFLIGQDARTGRIEMSEYGSDRPQVTSVAAAPAAAYTEVRKPAQTFDPETGEIYEEPRKGPIDLRAAANQ